MSHFKIPYTTNILRVPLGQAMPFVKAKMYNSLLRSTKILLYGVLLLCSFVLSCASLEEKVEQGLNQATERPQKGKLVSEHFERHAPVLENPHLYCISNLGQTMSVYDLTDQVLNRQSQKQLLADPIGPWFFTNKGYYLSRVASDGSGKNELIEFNPQTLNELRHLTYPPNSNPSNMLVLPEYSEAWILLKGSTFDSWKTNGISIVDLVTLKEIRRIDLNTAEYFIEGNSITSLEQFIWDSEQQRLYVMASNWRFEAQPGWLLVFELSDEGEATWVDHIPLGVNPQGDMLLDEQGRLWVVNTGGFIGFGGQPGSIHVLDTSLMADGIKENERLHTIPVEGDPLSIHRVSETEAWVLTYPDGIVRQVNLEQPGLLNGNSEIPNITGFFYEASDGHFYAGSGGFGHAFLLKIDPVSQQLSKKIDLQAGNGMLHCAEYDIP